MDVGIQMIFSTYGWPGMSDREAWNEEIRLARLADELGFDAIWAVEHHFFDYSFCPDNLQFLSIWPACAHLNRGDHPVWNDPLPVTEVAVFVRTAATLSLGRGLARRNRAGVPARHGRLA